MARILKSRLDVAALVGALVIASAFFGPLEYGLKYLHFSVLTKERLVREAGVYIRERTRGGQLACLYVVRCDSGAARLELVVDISTWDFDDTKRTIWNRRFSSACQGRTTNFALHLIPMLGQEPEIDAVAHASWSFFNDRFIPIRNRFQSGSFTDQPWEPCTKEKAVAPPR